MSGYIHTSNYGGWRFNSYPYDPVIHVLVSENTWRMRLPSELPQIPDSGYFALLSSLTHRPFFHPSPGPSGHEVLFDEVAGANTPGSNYAENKRNTLISQMIPCTTYAAGRNALGALGNEIDHPIFPGRNIDMDRLMKTDANEWPLTSEHDPEENRPRAWLHSDIREKAFTHNWNAYKKFVDFGNLNEQP